MKSRRALAAALLILALALVPMIPSPAAGSTPYSEKLTVYVAGSSAFWSLSLGGVNTTNSYIAKLESIPGVSSYNVTAVKTTGWTSDFQIFGPQGYNVLPVPFIPQQGLFLQVSASGYGDAASAAQTLDRYFVTHFSSTANGTGTYTFFAPISFNTIVPKTLMRFIPVSMNGFESIIGYLAPARPGNFTGFAGPIIALSGSRASSGFAHTLTLSAFSAKALTATQTPALLTYFGASTSVLRAANKSSSSIVYVKALDGVITPTNLTGVSNDFTHFTGAYSLSLSPGAKLKSLNISLVQQPPQLLITRSIDAGTLSPKQTVSVTLTFRNLSNTTTIDKLSLKDSWWQSFGFFKLVTGNSSNVPSKLAPGAVITPTYQLEYTGNSTQQVTIPAETASYSFVATDPSTGKSVNSSLTLHSNVNEAFLLLGPNVREPVVFAYLTTMSSINGPVGSVQKLKLVVQNVGTRTADNLAVNGQLVGALAAGSTLPYSPISVTAPSLTGTNVTEHFTLSYMTPEGQSVTLDTNSLHVLFPHANMKVAFTNLVVNSTAHVKGSRTNLTVTFATSNSGVTNATSFTATAPLPSGLSCGKAHEASISCSNGVITLTYSNMKPKSNFKASMSFNLTQPESYVWAPVTYVTNSSGLSLRGVSNGLAVPSGLSLSKTFSPNLLFAGMRSSVALSATNRGPYPLYNATVAFTGDAFDILPASSPQTSTSNSTITAGKSLTYAYNVTLLSTASGNQTGTIVAASFYFGGTKFTTNGTSSWVQVYKPLSVSITPTPTTPVEGKEFFVLIKITNPSPLVVSRVNFALSIPPDVRIVSSKNATFSHGVLFINASQLGKNGVYVANITATASSGVSIPFSSPKLSLIFSYAGQSVKGTLPGQGIAINEDVLTRYVLPVGLAFLVLLAVAVFVRRMAAGPSAPAAPR
jgi:hypothetical protein